MSETETQTDGTVESTEAQPEGEQNQDQQQSTDDQQQAGDQSTEGKQDEGTVLTSEAEGAPEKYEDFALPEGMELDTALVEKVAPVFKELNLTQGQAQKLVDAFASQREAEGQALQEAFDNDVKQWKQEAEQDKEVGGPAFNENVGTAIKALDRFGTPELKSLLDSTGLGNHPEVIRFMWRVGKTIKEDQPGTTDGGAGEEQDQASRWYAGSTPAAQG